MTLGNIFTIFDPPFPIVTLFIAKGVLRHKLFELFPHLAVTSFMDDPLANTTKHIMERWPLLHIKSIKQKSKILSESNFHFQVLQYIQYLGLQIVFRFNIDFTFV